MSWFNRRTKRFENPVPLVDELVTFVGRVAVLEPVDGENRGSAVCGYLFLEKVIISISDGNVAESSPRRPREVIAQNLVTQLADSPSEFLQDYYCTDSSVEELLDDRITLYGDRYQLRWLEGADREQILEKYFRP